MYVTSEDGLLLRKEPGTDYDVMETIPDQTEAVATGWENGWVYVEYNGKNG